MKNEKKQEFKSSGVLTLLGLVGFSATIIAAPWNRQAQDSQVDIALQKAEVVGYQVVQIYREATKTKESSIVKNGGRMPASVASTSPEDNLRSLGTMGTDPWGQAYHYRILPSLADQPKKIRILVWSSGPNKKVETPDLENEDKKISAQPLYQGDDVGVVLSMSQN